MLETAIKLESLYILQNIMAPGQQTQIPLIFKILKLFLDSNKSPVSISETFLSDRL